MLKIRRRLVPLLAGLALAAGTLAGCGGSHAGYYDTICVDPLTQMRMPDLYCVPGVYYQPSWIYYVPYGYAAPAVGVRVVHWSRSAYSRPAGATIHTGGVPTSGGKASKYSTGNVSTSKGGKTSTKRGTSGGGGSSRNSTKRGYYGGGSSRRVGGSVRVGGLR